jgi:hypothetical protein
LINVSFLVRGHTLEDVEPEAARRSEHPLICAECDGESEAGAVGWRAYLDCEDAVVCFCPECATREFDGE